MSLTLRALVESDAAAAAALHVQGFPDPWSAASITSQINAPNVLALGIDDAGALIAFVLFQSAAGDTELLTIATDPARRGEGHGRRLIEAALPRLATTGNTRLLLEVAEDNAPARHLYTRLGFTLDGRRKGYYTSGRAVPVDALLMSRPLGG